MSDGPDTLDNLFTGTLEGAYDAAESGEEYKPPSMAEALDPDAAAEETASTDDDSTTLDTEVDETQETSDPASKEDESEPSASEQAPTPPPQWSAGDKAAFSKLSREAQDFVLQREREVSAHLTQETQALAKQRQEIAGVAQVLEPRRQALAAEFGSVEKGIDTLLQLSDFAGRDPKGFVEFFAKQHGVDLGAANVTGADDDVGDPQVQQLTRRLQEIEGRFQAAQQQQAAEMSAAQQAEIESFKTAVGEDGELSHPHFDAVRPQMAKLVQSGAATTLDHAYEMAVWAHGETRKLMLEAKATQEEAKRVSEAKAAAKAAKRAAGTKVRSRGGVDTKAKQGTIQSTMEAAYDRIQGTG